MNRMPGSPPLASERGTLRPRHEIALRTPIGGEIGRREGVEFRLGGGVRVAVVVTVILRSGVGVGVGLGGGLPRHTMD